MKFAFEVSPRKVTRSIRTKFNVASKGTYHETGKQFHAEYAPRRFTEEHGYEAGYTPRDFRYMRRKFRLFKHIRPLEFTGETKNLMRIARTVAIGGGPTGQNGRVRVIYPYGRGLNRRSRNTRIRMSDEFRKVLPKELNELGQFYERRLDEQMAKAFG